MTKNQEMQRIIRRYKDVTGETEVDMHRVAEWAHKELGWPLPRPANPMARLAKEFASAAREEMRTDTVTGFPYRANHALQVKQGPDAITLWIDIDENPTRSKMQRTLTHRREQMVGDAVQLRLDADHWNRVNPDEEPIQVELDLTPDADWRLAAPNEEAS